MKVEMVEMAEMTEMTEVAEMTEMKILRASGHVTAPAIDPTSVILRNGALTSNENQHYVMSVLQNGIVPPLPSGCTHHFFVYYLQRQL